ncbi:TrkH family potassium uptake protein [Pseudochelatococcus sp. B33]
MIRSQLQVAAVRRRTAHGLRPIAYFVGIILLATSAMMLLPLLVDVYFGNRDWQAFAFAILVSLIVGGMLTCRNKGALKAGLTLRQAFILTPASWISVAAVSSLPFFFSDYGIVSGSLVDSVFEAVSGITATGATVISGLDNAPPGMLLWRALLQWMGGIGIIASAMAILPALGIGGMQLFRTESSDRSEKALPKSRQILIAIANTYIGLTALAILVYWFLGMSLFDAVAQALASISTGGFSTSDASFGKWQGSGIQWFATLFMLLGSVPFVLYVRFIAGDMRALWDRQVRTLLVFLAVIVICLGFWLFVSEQYEFEAAFRYAAFNVVSVVTTTGFATADYALWGNAVVGLFFILTFVGGCTGSTTGGIKVFRFEIVAIMLRVHFQKLLYPSGVFPHSYAGRVINDGVIGSVIAFLSVFFICYLLLTIALMAFGLDFLTSASGAATALANVGPGLGGVIGPAGNFAPLPEGAKWLLSAGMLLGRLELFTILVLFIPRFWRG